MLFSWIQKVFLFLHRAIKYHWRFDRIQRDVLTTFCFFLPFYRSWHFQRKLNNKACSYISICICMYTSSKYRHALMKCLWIYFNSRVEMENKCLRQINIFWSRFHTDYMFGVHGCDIFSDNDNEASIIPSLTNSKFQYLFSISANIVYTWEQNGTYD